VPDLVELVAGVAVVGGVLYASRVPRARAADGDPEEARVAPPEPVPVPETDTAPPGSPLRR